jgi:hypothetical protein
MKLVLVLMDEDNKRVYYTEPLPNNVIEYGMIRSSIGCFETGVIDALNDIRRDIASARKFVAFGDAEIQFECARRGLKVG